MATCPECEFDEIDTEDLEEGDRLSCPECGKSLVMVGSDALFLPLCMQFGMAPEQFGVMMLINCALGLNTPPVGTTQFVGCAIGEISVGQVMRSILPFYGALGVCLMLVTYVPAFSLWLPHALK